ncbi:uncharacterized protein LOC129587701 [Paramacrobiotus metropolitanus]|uniref:uncharacterized protein LOC129587701 n=1 Tax=Paramacrobiotus metropolitanus TaxID=2943436 RepID=UPI00244624F5|nr:uncharacterized protein LOC129587701 [Paramacrobiotus metropolitanus]
MSAKSNSKKPTLEITISENEEDTDSESAKKTADQEPKKKKRRTLPESQEKELNRSPKEIEVDIKAGVPASSTAAERLFSQSGYMINNRRTSLDTETVDDLLFVKWNANKI